MTELTIDGKQIEVADGTTILEAAQSVGIHVPRYCYHPKLSISANCRMCLVEVEKSPKLLTACSTQVCNGMIVRTDTEKVKAARRDVLEFLLINHPLDCPICDQAGECGLQNYYMDHSRASSRFKAEDKIRRKKRRILGQHLVLDNERCILCTRCVRFCSEVTKTSELEIMERGDHSFVDLKAGQTLDNDYSMNLADICPVGAWTSRDFRFKQRVWFLNKSPSTCLGCATGCLTEVHHNDNVIYRIVPRPNAETNTWLCDRGRLLYRAVAADDRLAMGILNNSLIELELALREAAALLDEKTGVLASPWLSLEDNTALTLLAEAMKTRNFCCDFVFEQGIKDGILINRDPSPNSAGTAAVKAKCDSISLKEFKARLMGGKIKLVLAEAQAANLIKKEISDSGATLIVFATNRSDIPAGTHIALPYASYFETSGTFINFQNLRRLIQPAIKPPEGVPPLWQLLNKLAAYAGISLKLDSVSSALEKVGL